MRTPNFPARSLRIGLTVLIGIIGLVVIFAIGSRHMYLFKQVDVDQIGVMKRGGQIYRIVPPGLYSDVALFAELVTYSTEAYQFSVADKELITSDSQRIGVTVSGSVFRPDYSMADRIPSLWARYNHIFTNNDALQAVANDLSAQAMKVCVGGKPFRDSIIGAGRDTLRTCIDEELSELAVPYGLEVSNVTVPNVELSPEVQGLLDAITKSRLETEKGEQDRLRAISQGEAARAEQEAQIRTEQSRAQEEAKQKALLAELTRNQLAAELQVIDAQKTNDLLAAQRDLDINAALAEAAIEKAKADLAREIALAELYSGNPNYYNYQLALANASAIKSTDKLIFVPPGSFPQLVFGNNLQPVVPVGAETPELPQ